MNRLIVKSDGTPKGTRVFVNTKDGPVEIYGIEYVNLDRIGQSPLSRLVISFVAYDFYAVGLPSSEAE